LPDSPIAFIATKIKRLPKRNPFLSSQPITYRAWVAKIGALADSIRSLDHLAQEMGLPPAEQAEWHGNLFQKLLPQLAVEPFLVVAVTGGTNTGKSAVFNHLVGSRTSLVDPNATQTRHPVCSVAKKFLAEHRGDLERTFADFELHAWQSERDAVEPGPANRLVVREAAGTQPERLLLLDTPDVDGTLKENWRLAEIVRHAADMLVCVLTQQKYNDAAVRDFFRRAAEVDKTVMVVFNMVHAPETPRQREVVAGWLKTFRAQTGVEPMHVYVAPWDEAAVEANRLPFFPLTAGASDPRRDLADLQFEAIKIRSFRGSLRGTFDMQNGVPAFLDRIAGRANQYAQLRGTLARMHYSDRLDLPAFPPRLLMNEIWNWLAPRRTRFDRLVHGAAAVGWSAVTGAVRKVQTAAGRMAGGAALQAAPDEVQQFHQRERDCLRIAVARWLDRLDDYRRVGSELLKAELEQALVAVDRQRLFDELERRHRAMPMISESSRRFIHEELDQFERNNPRLVKTLTAGILAAAVARPVATVTLGYMGGHAFDSLAWHVVVNWMTDLTAGAAGAAVGEAAVVQTGQIALVPLVRRLYTRLYQERTEALFNEMNSLVLGPIFERIDRFAAAADTAEFRTARESIAALRLSFEASGAAEQIA
jgi:hypothetical protein